MKQTILVLEDDIQLSDTIKQFLQMNGYAVLCAYDGLVAEDIVYEKHIDLMLLDVKVPRMSGFEFLKKIRTEGREIPAIFITSLNSTEDVEKGFMLGCDDYIRKPFALKELLVRVESLLKRSFGTYHDRVDLGGGMVFDIKDQELLLEGTRIPLKTKELKLLALLLQNPKELLTYERIFEAVWEYTEESNAGSLRTYIKRLRAQIGKEKIETIKKVGYRFVG
jgi:DNA-binding response OmpR family regulator